MKPVDLTGHRFGRWTVLALHGLRRNTRTWTCRCDCGRERTVEGGNLTAGRSTSCGCARPGRPQQRDVTYSGAHQRVRRTRGPADAHSCVDCPQAADQWSYDGHDPAEVTQQIRGLRVAYSLDPDRYQPRCTSHHVLYDRARSAERSTSCPAPAPPPDSSSPPPCTSPSSASSP